MGAFQVSGKIQEAQIEAVIVRADGTEEKLGTVAYYHRNLLKRVIYQVKRLLNGGNSY